MSEELSNGAAYRELRGFFVEIIDYLGPDMDENPFWMPIKLIIEQSHLHLRMYCWDCGNLVIEMLDGEVRCEYSFSTIGVDNHLGLYEWATKQPGLWGRAIIMWQNRHRLSTFDMARSLQTDIQGLARFARQRQGAKSNLIHKDIELVSLMLGLDPIAIRQFMNVP